MAEDAVTSVLECDIQDRDAHKLLEEVAVGKFRVIIAKGFACGKRTQHSFLQFCFQVMNKELTIDEIRLGQLELMKIWCDRVENIGNALSFIKSKVIIHMIAAICERIGEPKLCILCLYLTFNATLKDPDPQSVIVEQEKGKILMNISSALINLGNFESARKILTMAINLEDSLAYPEVNLMNQVILCDLQLQAGALDEPLQKLAQIRKRSEERGIRNIVVFCDMLISRTKISIHQAKSGNALLDNLRPLLTDTQGAEIDYLFNSEILTNAEALSPDESNGVIEQTNRLANRLVNNPLTRNPGMSKSLDAAVRGIQSMTEGLVALTSGIASPSDLANLDAFKNAQQYLDIYTEEERKSGDIFQELLLEPYSAFLDVICGRIEQANEKFERCLNLARSHQQYLLLPKICLIYALAIFLQKNVDKALNLSLEAENSFLELYRKTTSEDQKITINQEKCLLGSLQVLVYVFKQDYFKALYACERYRMPSLRKELQLLPNVDDLITFRFISHMHYYSLVKSSIIVYLSEVYGYSMFCWIVLHESLTFFGAPLIEWINIMPEQNDNMVKMVGLQMLGRSRTFESSINSHTKSEQCQQIVNIASRLLWQILSKEINFNLTLSNPKRIVFIPEKRLQLIPYAILGNNSASNSLLDYPLLQNFIISQSPSFWALSNIVMKESNTYNSIQRERRPLALIIGNPQSNLPDAEEESLLVTQNLKEHTEFEVLKLTQDLATRDIVLDSISHSKIVHIASHGNLEADEQHIRAGAIYLSDGILYAKEIEVYLKLIFIGGAESGGWGLKPHRILLKFVNG